jgi:hypothetical protein
VSSHGIALVTGFIKICQVASDEMWHTHAKKRKEIGWRNLPSETSAPLFWFCCFFLNHVFLYASNFFPLYFTCSANKITQNYEVLYIYHNHMLH